MAETNLAPIPDTDPWWRLAVGSPWDGFALAEEIPLTVAAQAFDEQQAAHRAALAFLQAEVEARGWVDVLTADGVTHVRDLFGAGGTPERRRLLPWLEEQLSMPARERFARYWYGWEEAPPLPDRPDVHWLTVALQTWDPTHPPHQAALAYLEGALRERGFGGSQRFREIWHRREIEDLQALVALLPGGVVQTFQELWEEQEYLPPWVQRARAYNGHPQQVRAIAWLEGRLAAQAQEIASPDLIQLFERSRQRDSEAIAQLQQLERGASPEIRQRFSEYWEA
ncbi:MAG: hypothetical protein ACUVSQ_11620 [Pseudanabaenaceae cyanobacterium]